MPPPYPDRVNLNRPSLRAEIRAALQVRPVDSGWAFALRAGLAVALPLVVLTAAGRPAWAGVATFGAFTALYARDEPYRRRAVLLGAAALGLTVAVLAGSLAALAPEPGTASVAAVALVGAAATLLCNRYRVGPPSGLMFAFATAVASALPARPADLPRAVALVAATAAVSWLIAMAGVLVWPDGPRRLAIARALRAAAALHAAPDGPDGLRARQQTALAVDRAWRAAAGRPVEAALVAHAETELSGVHGHDTVAAAELRGLADRLMTRGPLPRVEPTAAENARIAERAQAAILLDLPAEHGGPRRPLWPAAARVAVGALAAGAAAGLLAHVTDLGHPYWAAVSAVAVLQAASLRLSLHRAVQRAGGTIAGLLLAGAAVALPGGPWVLVAAIVAAQIVAELLVTRNYGLAMLAVTPLALLVGELGHETPALTLIGDRLTQTVLGCLLGLAAALLVRNRAAARHLDEAIRAVATATTEIQDKTPAAVRHQAAPDVRPKPAAPDVRYDHAEARRLARLVATMREAYEVAAGEPGLPPDVTDRVLHAESAARAALISRPGRPSRPG
jgi:uncharacterized membrane protein YccC